MFSSTRKISEGFSTLRVAQSPQCRLFPQPVQPCLNRPLELVIRAEQHDSERESCCGVEEPVFSPCDQRRNRRMRTHGSRSHPCQNPARMGHPQGFSSVLHSSVEASGDPATFLRLLQWWVSLFPLHRCSGGRPRPSFPLSPSPPASFSSEMCSQQRRT